MAESYDDVLQAMTFKCGEPRTFHRFLDKFNILNELHWTPDLIDKSIESVCGELNAEGVDYTWMRFTINKYMQHLNGWHRHEVIKFIYESFERHAPGKVGLVLCLKYEATRANQRQCAALIGNDDVAKCVVGIDLVGDEAYFDHKFYGQLLKPWNDAGKLVFAHLGESQPAKNVILGAKHLGVTEICHGIRAIDDPYVMAYAKDNDLCFHMALTSNVLTGVLDDDRSHPLPRFLRYGIKCTIGTDDPVQCGTTMDREYDVCREYGLNDGDVELLKLTAAERTRRWRIA